MTQPPHLADEISAANLYNQRLSLLEIRSFGDCVLLAISFGSIVTLISNVEVK